MNSYEERMKAAPHLPINLQPLFYSLTFLTRYLEAIIVCKKSYPQYGIHFYRKDIEYHEQSYKSLIELYDYYKEVNHTMIDEVIKDVERLLEELTK